MVSDLDKLDREQLEHRVRQLEQENTRLRLKSQDVALANVNAAMQMVELTERRAQELEDKNREVQAALAAAEEASRMKSRFLANMSHELRSPIAGIIGMSELLIADTLSSQQRDRAAAIASTAESFLDLVNQLLDFAKAEADAIQIERVEFDLWQTLESVAQLLQVSTEERGVEFVFELDPRVPQRVIGDPLRVRQVVLNLGMNAVKFTERGAVSLSVRSCPAGVCIVVTDSGIGFDAEVGARLFQPFVQADVSTTRRYGGTGLGLSICRRLVESMHGEISFSSEPGSGSTFEVRLPLPAARTWLPPTSLDRVVRLVATRPATMRMLAQHLPALGFRVIDEDSAEQADLVVLEPACDGERAVERWRRRDGATPLLLVGSPGASLLDDAARRLGVIGVLHQPPRPTQIASLLRGGAQDASRPVGESRFALRVLVADDSPINLRIVSERLQRLGCEVVTATDGQQAVTRFEAAAFDLVMLDCQMPLLDGYGAARGIRAIERRDGRDRVLIVALTADATGEREERCREAGMDESFIKPMRAKQFVELLERVAQLR
ncbi:MAG: ATP-binding protein [Planctomycetota bacterium]